MTNNLDTLSWPASRLGEAMDALARKSGLVPRPVEIPTPPNGFAQADAEALGRWIEAAADCLGLEAEPLEAPYGEAEQLVRNAGPALLRLPGKDEPRFLALLDGQRMVSVLGPDLTVHRLQPEVVRTALCQALEAPVAAEVDRLLNEAGVPERRWSRAREAILRELLSSERLAGSWLLRLPPGAPFWQQLHQARLSRRLLALVGAHAVQYLLWLLSWGMVGQGALQGRLDWGWLLAWALLLLTLVPFRLLATWLQGLIAIGAGGLLKQRLLSGALRFEPDEIRHQGAGQLLGRVIEAEAVESLALSGGFLALVSGIELVMAALVLGAGAGGWLHAFLLGGWVTFTCCIGWQYFRRRRHWAKQDAAPRY